jgi:hypothetical protein
VPMMVVVREPVTTEAMSATNVVKSRSGTETATLERRSRSEPAAAEMHTASTVMAPAEMHATAAVTASAEMHAASAVATSAKMAAASTVATSAKVTATAMTTTMTTAHLRGQALRNLLGHTRITRIDQ